MHLLGRAQRGMSLPSRSPSPQRSWNVAVLMDNGASILDHEMEAIYGGQQSSTTQGALVSDTRSCHQARTAAYHQ